jgi:hypothetical protein
MSQNIEQIYVANPITSNAATDLMYVGQSPYGAGNDAAITFANFSAQIATGTINQVAYFAATGNAIAGLAVADNGLLVTGATGIPSILAGPGATGKMLQSNAAAAPSFSTATYPSVAPTTGTLLRANGTNWVATTSTFADTYAINTLLYASSANGVTGLATANSASLVTDGSGVPAWQTLTAGQILVGTTAGAPASTVINSGTGILVANSSGSITINATGGGLASVAAASTPITAAINTAYYITDASQVTITLPAVAAAGSVVKIVGNGAGGWILAPGSGQTIKVLTASASTSITTAEQYDCIEVYCTLANTTWVATSYVTTAFTIV